MLKTFTKLAQALLVSLAVLFCGLPQTSLAIPFSQISQVYFFGDSLTDSGFNDLFPFVVPGWPAGKAPTWTTFGGYTWSQYIARDIKGFVLPVYPGPNPPDTITNNTIPIGAGNPVSGTLNGVDYAAGGSTTNSTGVIETYAPSLIQQVSYYLSTVPGNLDPNAVYFLWSGANDFLALLLTAPPIPTEAQLLATARQAAINIGTAASMLAARGAKRIVVLSLPNLGIAPLITDLAVAFNMPTLPASMKTLTFSFNSMLNTSLGQVRRTLGVKLLLIDVYNLLDQVIIATQKGQPYVVAGQAFQFVNYTSPACAGVPTALLCPSTAPSNYVFADTLHPTDMAHRVLSLTVETEIQKWK